MPFFILNSEAFFSFVLTLFQDVEGAEAVASWWSDGWILDGCSGRDEEVVILCLQHLVALGLEQDVPQRFCADRSFSFWVRKSCAMRSSLCLVCVSFMYCLSTSGSPAASVDLEAVPWHRQLAGAG